MKIISLNHDYAEIEVFHITDEYKKWCETHADKYDEDDIENNEYSECFNDFVTELFRSLGYDNPEFKNRMRVDDNFTVKITNVYPQTDTKPAENKEDTFKVVCWPDVQFLMGIEGFRENSFLINDEKGMEEFGSSAYFVRSEWLRKHVEKTAPFNIPDLKELERQVTEYVKAHQGELGFIPTDHPDGNIILTFIYEETYFESREYVIKAVRINKEGKLQILYDLASVKYFIESTAQLEDKDWTDIDDENVYYEQTLLNIAYNLPSYENL